MKLINLPLLAIFTSTLATPTLDRRNDGVVCKGTAEQGQSAWHVVVNHDSVYDKGPCGQGFLDNFRGWCGDITDWGCDIGPNDSANMNFVTSIFCTASNIAQAISAATSNKVHLDCSLT